MEESYLLRMFYIKKDMVEYKIQDLLLLGNDYEINKIVKKEIDTFNNLNNKNGYKVESYSLFKHIKSENLKD